MFRWLRLLKKEESQDITVNQAPSASAPATPLLVKESVAAPPAVAPDPILAHEHFELGNQALGRGQLDDAERHLRQALSAQGDHLQALCNLGALLKDRGRHAEAVIFLERALQKQPRMAAA